MADQRCVVFDLDGTLLASDSVRNLILHVLGRSPVRLSLALLTSPMWLALGVRRATRLQAERVVLWSVTVGRSATDFAELVREFAAEYAGESGGRRHTVTLQR
ncbi:MAG: HAD family hydrolase, partial [Janthinobacterium lividum]